MAYHTITPRQHRINTRLVVHDTLADQFEPMLLGIVVPDPAEQAFIVRSLRELTERLQAEQTVPSLRRGGLR